MTTTWNENDKINFSEVGARCVQLRVWVFDNVKIIIFMEKNWGRHRTSVLLDSLVIGKFRYGEMFYRNVGFCEEFTGVRLACYS